ncbi:unnamed protein product, partial [Brassica rapa]
WLIGAGLLPVDVGDSAKSTIPSEKTVVINQKFHSHHSKSVSNEAGVYSPALFRSSEIKLTVFLITKPLPGIVVFHSRGFVVQGSLDPKDRSLDEAFRIIDSVGWAYTVMHVHPFYPRVVREFISNQPFDDDGVLIRGHVFQFNPSVIDRLMMTPSVTQSFGWRDVVLKQAISHLTGGECSGWTGFNLNALLKPFQALYRVCELNWLPGTDTDLMIKNRLRLIYAVAERKPISFGHLVYDQVIEMTRLTDTDMNLVFPNLIYQLLVLQHEVPLLPGDEEAIGRGLPIHGFADDTSGRRGRRRIN